METGIAFYKGPAKGFLKIVEHTLIRLVTRSKYSHCELVINNICYSSSGRDGGIRFKKIDLNSGHWDVIALKFDKEYAQKWFFSRICDKYDFIGVIRVVFRWLPKANNKWFCSEACAEALKIKESDTFSPASLHKYLMEHQQYLK